jgi:general secretion pathway protein M
MTTMTMPIWLPADQKKRRWLAITLLVLALGSIIAVIVVPAVLLHRHYDESIAKFSRQVSTQTAFNALRPRLSQKLELLKSRDVKKLFLKGASSALASAELQDIVRATIDGNGGRVGGSSVPPNAPKDEGPYRQVTANFSFSANNVNLRRVIHALESKEPYLYIDTLVISASVPPGWRPPPNSVEPEMNFVLDVHAFALRTPSEMAPPAPQADSAATAASGAAKARTLDPAPRTKGGTP